MMPTSGSTNSLPTRSRSDLRLGMIYLGLNLLISVAAQFVLKGAMLKLGAFAGGEEWMSYLLQMINIEILGGLLLYGLGTILWILCLGKLDLSVAYPAGTLQYLFIFTGAWWWFGEQISNLRLLGMLVICAGVMIMSLGTSSK